MLAVVASTVLTDSACAQDLGPPVKELLRPLAGQSAAAIDKQLSDYRSDARANPLMTPVAKRLTKTELAGVAVYFVSYREQNARGPQGSHKDVYRRGNISVRLSDDQMMRLGFIYQGAL
jgi:cytochrome c553